MINDVKYCEKLALQGKNFETQDSPKVIFSDYLPGNLVKDVLGSYGRLVHTDNHIGSTNLEYSNLDPSITMFFHKSDWHTSQMIGKSFLCEGQRYNHIPGNKHLVYKDLISNHIKSYAKHYNYNKTCFDYDKFMPESYDLTNIYECIQITSLLAPSFDIQ